MEVQYQNEGFHQYMVLNPEHISIDGYEINMLAQFRGASLLPVRVYGKNEQILLQYDITGMMNVYQMTLDRELNGEFLGELFEQLWKCCDEMEEYLMSPEAILLNPRMIFYHPGKSRIQFCYLPGEASDFGQQFLKLIEFCLKCVDHKNENAVIYIYGLYRQMQNGYMNREEIQDYLLKHTQNKKNYAETGYEQTMQSLIDQEPSIADSSSVHPGIDASQSHKSNNQLLNRIYIGVGIVCLCSMLFFGLRFFLYNHSDHELKMIILSAVVLMLAVYCVLMSKRKERQDMRAADDREDINKKSTDRDMSNKSRTDSQPSIESSDLPLFLETSVLTDNSMTSAQSVPNTIQECVWVLKSMVTEIPDVMLYRLPGVIGRQKDCDYVLPESGISRRHAMIFESGSELYVEDLGSTNGTYVNDIRLAPGEPHDLCETSVLCMGGNPYRIMKCDHS